MENIAIGHRRFCHHGRSGITSSVGADEMSDWSSALISIGIFAFAGNTMGAFVGDLTTQDPVSMHLVSLDYSDGQVTQRHEVFGTERIIADWAAQVTRDNQVLCSGGDKATYNGITDKMMSLDFWVGDTCPELQKGDALVASWEYLDSQNLRYRISGTKLIE
ncbi:MAG: hypothetical protein AB8G77_16185 [Rhodothermales bacterium]